MKSLRSRLEEAEQALAAIWTGEIDALIVPGKNGEQVYTLKGAEHSYVVLLEGLNEAALTLTLTGTILYCNSRFSEMTKTPPDQLLGSSILGIIQPAEKKEFETVLHQSAKEPVRKEFNIQASDRTLIPVLFSIKKLLVEGMNTVCAVVTDITERKRTEEAFLKSERYYRELFLDEQRMQGELQRLSREILRVQEEERMQISRELHDEMGQTLTAIGVNLEKLRGDRGSSEAKKKIQSIQTLLERGADFIHDFSRQIHPNMLEDLGLFPALRSFVRSFQENTGMQVSLKLSGDPGKASVEQKAALYRIVQESLTNVLKHSGTLSATVTVRKLPRSITVEIADCGKGFTLASISGTRHGFGILGMRERARLVGAKFTILSRLGKGTRVRVHLPLAGGGARILKKKEPHDRKN